MKLSECGTLISNLEDKATIKARQGIRSVMRYVTDGWDADLHAYRDWTAEAAIFFWRVTRIKELVKTFGPEEDLPEEVASQVQAVLDEQPPWQSEPALARAQAIWGDSVDVAGPSRRELLGLPPDP